jgi:hypothetical protein
MLEFEAARASEIVDWPTDGIPTVRPSLGTIFIPAAVGQAYELRPGAMPWPGETLGRDEIRSAQVDPASELISRALEFYRLAASKGERVCLPRGHPGSV